MGYIGWLYFYLWYSSILAGYAGLFCPLLPILFVSNRFYRYLSDAIFTYWQYYPTALLEILCKCDIQVTGDSVKTSETSLLVINHRTRTDWNFLWPTFYHCVIGNNRLTHSTKFILKDAVRHIPGPGWVMQLACFIYIKRCWDFDRNILRKYADYVSKLSYNHSLILFPEGTDLTENTKRSSEIYAQKHKLQKYEYVLHPRTTGFTYLVKEMVAKNCLSTIYDATLVYPDVVPQTEKTLLSGTFPKTVKIHIVRYPVSVLPKSEEGLKRFLDKLWRIKEETLRNYWETGHFPTGAVLKRTHGWELYLALIFWSILPYVVLYTFLFVDWFRHLVIAHTLFLLMLNVVYDGFQNFEIAMFNLKRWRHIEEIVVN